MSHATLAQSTANDLTTAWLGSINQTTQVVSNLPANGRVSQLLSASAASAGATIQVVNASSQIVPRATVLSSSLTLVVTAASGAQKSYSLQPTGAALAVEAFSNAASSTQTALTNRLLSISGTSEFHVTGTNPLPGTAIDVQGTDVWLYFEGIRPSKFVSRVLGQVTVNGQRAQVDTTVRVVQYLQGCVLISQPSTYQPLEVFNATSLGGSSMKLSPYAYYKTADLGAFNDATASFRLKKGYMATFAENENGTGSSKVYVAANGDLVMNSMPVNLAGKVSLVRVFPWRWVSKKGFAGSALLGDSVHTQWNYNWNNNAQSTLDQEYVPIRQNAGWPAIATTNAKRNVTHLLGFNEPNSTQQSNLSPQTALLNWPVLLQSGLRVGSPACTDGGASWLYKFIDKCDSANYRVDYVAIHFYRGCNTAQQFYSFLKAIYDRTKRPIWITEFNNGANWTSSTSCPKPSYADEAAKIKSFITMLDTARIVERYSLYQWVEDTRKLYVTDSDLTSLTPAGIAYRDKLSPMAFNPNLVPPTVNVTVPVPFNVGNLVLTRYSNVTGTTTTNTTVPVYIDEVVPTSGSLYSAGQLVRSLAVNTPGTTGLGANFTYVGSALRGNGDGPIGISPDRTKMAVSGFNLAAGLTNANGTSAARVVAILDADGNLDTRTGFSNASGQPMRTAAVTDSATVYIAFGSGSASLGLRHASLPATTATSPTARDITRITQVNKDVLLKKMAIYDNELYFTQSTTGYAKLMKLNGLPTTTSTPAALPGLPVVASGGSVPSGFVMFDVNPNVSGFDLLYYADEPVSPATASVLSKYTFNGTTWTLRGTYTITGLNDNVVRDLTGTLVKGIPTLYAVSYTSLVRLEDKAIKYTLSTSAASYGLAPSITATPVLNSQAATATNYTYRGVAFAPGTRDSLYVRQPQTIAFYAIADQAQGTADFTAGATTTSGLEIGYSTSDLSVATVNNGLISIVGPGTVTITASQPGNYQFLPAASIARTFTVLSDLTVVAGQRMTMTSGSAYGNVLVQGSLTLNAPLTALGTIEVADGGLLDTNCQPITGAAAFRLAAGAELRICDAAGITAISNSGAVRTTGPRSYSPDATYSYTGTTTAGINPATGDGLPTSVRVLNVSLASATDTLQLGSDLTVSSVLNLSRGLLKTYTPTLSSAYTVTMSNASTNLSETASCFVLGRVRSATLLLDTDGSSSAFNGLGMRLVAHAAANLPGSTYVLRTTGLPVAGGGLQASIRRQYRVVPTADTNLNLDATFSFNPSSTELNGNSVATLQLFSKPLAGGGWQREGGTLASNAATLNGLTHLSDWTLSSVAAPLPVTLVQFEAQRQGENARLSWATASELDNRGFEVQASPDGTSFRALGFVVGAGSSVSTRSYQFLDQESGKDGLRYYRLRQVDGSGSSHYSPVRTVEFGTAVTACLVAVPNPFQQELTVLVTLPAASPATYLTLTDALGRRVYEATLPLAAGTSQVTLPPTTALPAGVYSLHLAMAGQPTQHMKVVKE